MKTALLLSGGMDSTALAFWKKPEIGITVNYGQKPAKAEIRAARAVCETLNIEHHIIEADLSTLGSGDMAGSAALKEAPIPEWWPYRNQLIITLASMRGIGLGVKKLLIGTLVTDAQHADGNPEFVKTISNLLFLQEGKMILEAPAINMTASHLIKISNIPLEILAWSHSCHTSEYACGMCRGCRKHYETMVELGFPAY